MRDGIAKLFFEERLNIFACLQLIERWFTLLRQEKCNGEASINVWKRDHHITVTWPDVQGILLHLEFSVGARGYFEFTVAVVNQFFVRLGAQVGGGAAPGATESFWRRLLRSLGLVK